VNQIHAWLEAKQTLPVLPQPKIDRVSKQVGQYVSMLIEDSSTLQIGIGKVLNSCCAI
jgi:hypothetical protein